MSMLGRIKCQLARANSKSWGGAISSWVVLPFAKADTVKTTMEQRFVSNPGVCPGAMGGQRKIRPKRKPANHKVGDYKVTTLSPWNLIFFGMLPRLRGRLRDRDDGWCALGQSE